MESHELSVSVVDWINNNLRFARWNNDFLEKNFGQRSAKDIIESGNVFYMGPCLDFSLITLQRLKPLVEKTDLIVEYLFSKTYGINALHFVSGYEFNGKEFYIDFLSGKKVIFGNGKYVSSMPEGKTITIQKFPGSQITSTDTLSDIVCGDLKSYFPDFSFKDLLERLKQANTPEHFTEFTKGLGIEDKINFERKVLVRSI